MTTKLRIAPDLALPTDAVTETFAFLGRLATPAPSRAPSSES